MKNQKYDAFINREELEKWFIRNDKVLLEKLLMENLRIQLK